MYPGRSAARSYHPASLTRDVEVMRCRTGIVSSSAFATIPDQRCTAYALHRIRETPPQNGSAMWPFSIVDINCLMKFVSEPAVGVVRLTKSNSLPSLMP